MPRFLPSSICLGAIPRLWAVQRSVAKVMSGPMSGAVTVLQTIGGACSLCIRWLFSASHTGNRFQPAPVYRPRWPSAPFVSSTGVMPSTSPSTGLTTQGSVAVVAPRWGGLGGLALSSLSTHTLAVTQRCPRPDHVRLSVLELLG